MFSGGDRLRAEIVTAGASATVRTVLETSSQPSETNNLHPQDEVVGVAILPFATARSGLTETSTAKEELVSFSNHFVEMQRDLKLQFSYYLPEFDQKVIGSPESIWNRGVTRRTPKTSQIYALGDHLDADVALTYFYKKRGADRYQDGFYDVDIYLFDVEQRRMYREQGNERNFKAVTKRALERLLAERGGVAQVY